jgi:hypothetical protein
LKAEEEDERFILDEFYEDEVVDFTMAMHAKSRDFDGRKASDTSAQRAHLNAPPPSNTS